MTNITTKPELKPALFVDVLDELIESVYDDVTVLGPTPLGKPHDPDPAIRTLRRKIIEQWNTRAPQLKEIDEHDGSERRVLVFVPKYGWGSANWITGYGQRGIWNVHFVLDKDAQPTHYQELPAPPSDES